MSKADFEFMQFPWEHYRAMPPAEVQACHQADWIYTAAVDFMGDGIIDPEQAIAMAAIQLDVSDPTLPDVNEVRTMGRRRRRWLRGRLDSTYVSNRLGRDRKAHATRANGGELSTLAERDAWAAWVPEPRKPTPPPSRPPGGGGLTLAAEHMAWRRGAKPVPSMADMSGISSSWGVPYR